MAAFKNRIWIFLFIAAIISRTAAQTKALGGNKNKGGNSDLHMISYADHDTCLDKMFSIVFYAPDNDTMQLNASVIIPFQNQIIAELNKAFARICVSFASCSTVIIPHYTFNIWHFQNTELPAIGGWYTDNVINFYLPKEFSDLPALESKGYAHAPGIWGAVDSPKDIVALGASTFTALNVPDLMHVMGHYFGLHDTYAEIGPAAQPPPAPPPPFSAPVISNEFADGSNCDVNGDGICDTEADPFPGEYYENPAPPNKPTYCEFHRAAARVDGKGDLYLPPLDNYMSQWGCRCKFTQQQYNRMARFIVKHRLHLH